MLHPTVTHLDTLELSQQPAERLAQVRILKNLFSLLSREQSVPEGKEYVIQMADFSAIQATVDAILQEQPEGEDFGSFMELEKKRDSTGVVRRQKSKSTFFG